MLQLDRPLVVFDLEATSTNPKEARVIQVAAQRIIRRNGKLGVSDRLSRLVNPGTSIPQEVVDLTGITNADVADAPPFGQVADALDRLIHDADLAGFNVHNYDVPLLEAEYERAGRAVPGPADREVLDVLRLEQVLMPRSLEALFERYTGQPLDGAHDAQVDVNATVQVLAAQLREHQPEDRTPSGLASLIRGDFLDDGRKLKRRSDGQVEICFGKHAGKTLLDLQRDHPGYLDWMRREITALRKHIDAALEE